MFACLFQVARQACHDRGQQLPAERGSMTGTSGCKPSVGGSPHLLKFGAAGIGPVVSLIVASDVVLEAADMEPTEGGGAFSFAFSARASSSLPRSTHILSCSSKGRTLQPWASVCVCFLGPPVHCPASGKHSLTHVGTWASEECAPRLHACPLRAGHYPNHCCIPCPLTSSL